MLRTTSEQGSYLRGSQPLVEQVGAGFQLGRQQRFKLLLDRGIALQYDV